LCFKLCIWALKGAKWPGTVLAGGSLGTGGQAGVGSWEQPQPQAWGTSLGTGQEVGGAADWHCWQVAGAGTDSPRLG